MRTLTHSGKPSQKSILGQKAMIRSFAVSKLKKTTNSTKPETKLDLKICSGLINENQLSGVSEKRGGILPASKKIQKWKFASSINQHLTDITIKINTPTPVRTLRSGKVFLEDGTKQTKNYEIISYKDSKSKKKHEFLCFPDRDLTIPVNYASKVVKHNCDNDCNTDDEQIESAIEDLFESLKISIEEQKKEKQSNKVSK